MSSFILSGLSEYQALYFLAGLNIKLSPTLALFMNENWVGYQVIPTLYFADFARYHLLRNNTSSHDPNDLPWLIEKKPKTEATVPNRAARATLHE